MAQLKLVTPTLDVEPTITGERTTPSRLPNAAYRSREYLTPTEMDAIIEAARKMHHGHRDATMLLVCYRHCFRASEICDLRWSQIDFDQARLAVRRSKRGTPSTHPILGDELRALRRLRRENPHAEFVFMSERGGPFSTAGFARLVERAGTEAGLGFKAHPHMLRHSTGYKLANDGVDTRALQHYLGHRNIQHTVRYSELSATHFNNFWK
jgi:type 1 fimbriae regulatory protein FimB/type 1 fimbriae regulatory protein FimE